MPLDKAVFKKRALTAALYAVVMLAGLLLNTWSFFILFSIVHFGCWYEYQKLAVLIDPLFGRLDRMARLHFPMLGWGLMMMASAESVELGGMHLSTVGQWVFRFSLLLFVAEALFKRRRSASYYTRSMIGLVYISVSLSLFVNLRSGWIWGYAHEGTDFTNLLSSFSGKLIALILVFSIWINDTMAYLVGSWIGKTPLSSWSPKKTWEGTLGGILLSIAVVYGFAFIKGFANGELILMVAVAAVSGTVGDLEESRLKRLAGVKDSGSFMPGHGGFLDRFDSILFAAPAVWLVAYFLYR